MQKGMRLILPAGYLPLNSKVTKATGAKVYTLTDKIKFWSKEGSVKWSAESAGVEYPMIKGGEDILYLVGDDGNVEIITKDTLVSYALQSPHDLKAVATYMVDALDFTSSK